MFDARSRYAKQPTAVHVDRDGQARPYVTRRERPRPSTPASADPEHKVSGTDRLDRLAWRELGSAQLFWEICDANDALHPDDLLRRLGRRIRIPKGGRP